MSKLIAYDCHTSHHDGVESCLCRLLSKYWIPKARKLIRALKTKCVVCRLSEKQRAGQLMGEVSEERMKPTPVFYNCATDIFGPFSIRDSVKRRVVGKCFGVMFTCLSSRAVHLEIA